MLNIFKIIKFFRRFRRIEDTGSNIIRSMILKRFPQLEHLKENMAEVAANITYITYQLRSMKTELGYIEERSKILEKEITDVKKSFERLKQRV